MKPAFRIAAALSALGAAAQPAHAAEDFRGSFMVEHRSAAFAGARVRIPLGGAGREDRAPSARLHIGVDHIYQDRSLAAAAVTYRVSAMELGMSRRGAPALFVAGAPVREWERRIGISTGGKIAIGVGVVLVAVIAVAAASGPPDDITP